MSTQVSVWQGDITTLDVDVIVNAAKESLLGGGGVDGAIHRAAGPKLLEECRTIGGCPTGEARVTQGYNLQARFVIHTVGPVWQRGDNGERELLENCYSNALKCADEISAKGEDVTSIAFPAISTGIYSYPPDQAAQIAAQTIADYIKTGGKLVQITLVAFDAQAKALLQGAVKDIFG